MDVISAYHVKEEGPATDGRRICLLNPQHVVSYKPGVQRNSGGEVEAINWSAYDQDGERYVIKDTDVIQDLNDSLSRCESCTDGYHEKCGQSSNKCECPCDTVRTRDFIRKEESNNDAG